MSPEANEGQRPLFERRARLPDDILLRQPVGHPHEGLPIGNGRMGTLVYTTPATIQFQVNRVDLFAVNRNTTSAHYAPDVPGTDYCGACARVTIDVGGEPFQASHGFRQSLSLQEARCTVEGEGVRASCWVAADDDVLLVAVTDERNAPRPIDLTLSMWRQPSTRHGAHTATYSFEQTTERITVRQTFTEGDHYSSSAVSAVSLDSDAQVVSVDAAAGVLHLPAARGTRTLAISSAASWTSDADAAAIAHETLTALGRPDALTLAAERHADWWREFWARTHIVITSPDGRGERSVRDRDLLLYHMGSSSRGAYPPKWNGSIFITDGDTRGWGAQFWLWTMEMLYWPLHAADAGELAEPLFEMYRNALPAMEIAARQRWDAAGIFLPETMPFDGPTELPMSLVEAYRERLLRDPGGAEVSPDLDEACRYDWHLEASTSRRAGEGGFAWISHLTSSGAELAVHAWWRYRHTGDRDWLRTHAYPLLRGVSEFYRSFCRLGDDGRWHVHGTNAHEDFWGVDDSIMDLAAIRGTVPLAIRAAELLGLDADLRVCWGEFLRDLAPCPTGSDPRAKALTGGALADDAWAAGLQGHVHGSHNSEDVQLTPIFPFENWTLETRDAAMDALARRTLGLAPRHRSVMAGEGLNTAIRTPVVAIRTGAGEALPDILDRYRAAFDVLPNGFSLFEGATAPSVEHLGLLTLTLQEALLQSVAPSPGEAEVIRVFPAWPVDWDATFRLLARGGFLVSSTIRDGQIGRVEIESRFGEECRLRNPWPQPARLQLHDGTELEDGVGPHEVVSFSTDPGGRYVLRGGAGCEGAGGSEDGA